MTGCVFLICYWEFVIPRLEWFPSNSKKVGDLKKVKRKIGRSLIETFLHFLLLKNFGNEKVAFEEGKTTEKIQILHKMCMKCLF